jgi:hypothetical protein
MPKHRPLRGRARLRAPVARGLRGRGRFLAPRRRPEPSGRRRCLAGRRLPSRAVDAHAAPTGVEPVLAVHRLSLPSESTGDQLPRIAIGIDPRVAALTCQYYESDSLTRTLLPATGVPHSGTAVVRNADPQSMARSSGDAAHTSIATARVRNSQRHTSSCCRFTSSNPAYTNERMTCWMIRSASSPPTAHARSSSKSSRCSAMSSR